MLEDRVMTNEEKPRPPDLAQCVSADPFGGLVFCSLAWHETGHHQIGGLFGRGYLPSSISREVSRRVACMAAQSSN